MFQVYTNQCDENLGFHWFKMVDGDVNIKEMAEKVLTESGYSDNRAAKMDINDILKYVNISHVSPMILSNYQLRLLSAFHDVGVHFS